MHHPTWIRQALPTAAVAAAVCVLGFYRDGAAQPPNKPQHDPFANNVAQNAEMLTLLRDISRQLKEQNDLLRTGTLQVSVVELKKK